MAPKEPQDKDEIGRFFGLIATTRSPGALPSLIPQTVVNACYF
jgi:hypothetical protein